MNTNAAESSIETLFEKAVKYSQTSMELIKLQAINQSSDFASFLSVRIVLSIVAFLFLMSTTIGLSLWIGDLLGKYYYGFFVIAGVYMIICILLYRFRNRWIKIPVKNILIKQFIKG